MIEKVKRMAKEEKGVLWIVRNEAEARRLGRELTKEEERYVKIKSAWTLVRGYTVDMVILDEVEDMIAETPYGEDYLDYLCIQMKRCGKLIQISTPCARPSKGL